MERSARKKFVAGLTVAATMLAGATAIAAGGSDESPPEPQAHGTLGGEVSAQGDTILGLKIHNVDPAALAPGLDTTPTWTRLSTGNCLRANGTFYAPVDLPQGADVFAVVADFNDSTATGNISLALRSRTFGTPSVENLFSGATGASETPGRTTLSLDDVSTTDLVQDKNEEAFFLYVFMNEEVSTLELCNIQVYYSAPEGGLEFHAVAPCAIFDTRPGQGGIERKLATDEQITVDTIMSDYSSQGGFAGSCGIPTAVGGGFFSDGEKQTVAVALNLVALQPDGVGNLRAWETGTGAPAGGVLVFNPGESNANELAINVAGGTAGLPGTNGGDIEIQNNGATVHVRAVVVGYYTQVDSRW